MDYYYFSDFQMRIMILSKERLLFITGCRQITLEKMIIYYHFLVQCYQISKIQKKRAGPQKALFKEPLRSHYTE